jgi:hypothetical protein
VTPQAKPLPRLDHPPGTAGALLQVAASQIGYREGSDNDNAFGVWYPMNHEPWCAMFVSWSAAQADVAPDVIPKHAYTPSGAEWFEARGRLHTTPQAGDIGYVFYDSLGRIGHVFVVETVSRTAGGATVMTTIEGNTNDTGSSQGNGVYRLVRGDTSHLSYGRPAYVASSEDDMSAQAEAQINEILGILKSTVAPGQLTFASTVEATLGSSQQAINEIRRAINEVRSSERLLVLGVQDSAPRFLVMGGRIVQIPTEVFRADLADSEAIRLVMVDPPTLEWLLDVAA